TEGLEILKKLPNEQLHDPHAAVYVALLLIDNNEPEAAREFIEAAQKGPLYVEEKKLLTEAIAKISAPTPSTGPASVLDNIALPTPSLTPRPLSSPLPSSNKIEPPGSTPVVHPLLRDGG
ncbi:MAG: hypothetical protein M3R10_00400, partial [Verrucomicrobiota bacterium]|nr:hypothetical protein [Verrucomicrobiota bacterium]